MTQILDPALVDLFRLLSDEMPLQVSDDQRQELRQRCHLLLLQQLDAAIVPSRGAAAPDVPVRAGANGAAAPSPEELAAPLPPGERELTYDDFTKLLERFNVPAAAGMGRWFRDYGGFDKSTPQQRSATYASIERYYSQIADQARAFIGTAQVTGDYTSKCPRCGGPVRGPVNGKFGPFYGCDNKPECKSSNGKGLIWSDQGKWSKIHDEQVAR